MNELLISAGLTDKEAQVYLSLLQLGTASVQKLATISGVTRVTAYALIDELQKKGLVRPSADKRGAFQAQHPRVLDELLKQQITNLQTRRVDLSSGLDVLEAMYNVQSDKPTVRYFEGKEGLIELDDYGWEQYPEGCTALHITPHDTIAREFKSHRKDALDKRVRRKIPSKVIYTSEKEFTEEENKKQLREALWLLPSELPINGTVVIQTGWGVKFYQYDKKRYFGVLLQSPEMAEMLEKVFMLAWQGARLIKSKRK